MSQQENWLPQQTRKQGLEIDSEGLPILNVHFYGVVPDNVITEEVPQEIDNPKWNGKEWVNDGERTTRVFRARESLPESDRKAFWTER